MCTLIIMLAMLGSVFPAKGYGDYLFLPAPQEIAYSTGTFNPGTARHIWVNSKSHPELLDTAGIVVGLLQSADYSAEITDAEGTPMAGGIRINPDRVQKRDGYELTITPKYLRIVANSPAGAFYAAQTLRQICLQAEPGKLACLTIKDWPDFPNRGIMLDISRDKVPTMDTLYKLVDLFADMKINQLQLYTEHTFAYQNHKVVWEKASPMTANQIRDLDGYCKERYIELVPNQNSFGHMEEWIKHKAYRHLSENPKGGSTFDPTNPEVIELMSELYDELLPNFSSKQFNVGCDEVQIGEYRSKAACDEKGKGRVYLEYLIEINELCRQHGCTMQFWGDIIKHHPEFIPELPKDIIAMIWGYGAKAAFKTECSRFEKAGVPFYVCPGTSSWRSILGRTDNAMGNLLNAAENGLKYGAIGYLNTDWGDYGHWQYLPISYPGFAYGAALSWAVEQNRELDVAKALDLFVFQDASAVMGQLMLDLGNVYIRLAEGNKSNQKLFYDIMKHFKSDDDAFYSTYTLAGAQAATEEIDRLVERLHQADMRCDDADLIGAEVGNAARFAKLLCRIASAHLLSEDQEPASARELQEMVSEHERLWLSRNRPGGLSESVRKMDSYVSSLLNLKTNGHPFEGPRAEWGAHMEIQHVADGTFQSVGIDGLKAWKPDGGFLYFKAPELNRPMNARLHVVYYDEGFGAIELRYDSTSEPFKLLAGGVKCRNSKQWKTIAIELPDAKFAKRCNGGDLRLQSCGVTIGGVYVTDASLDMDVF